MRCQKRNDSCFFLHNDNYKLESRIEQLSFIGSTILRSFYIQLPPEKHFINCILLNFKNNLIYYSQISETINCYSFDSEEESSQRCATIPMIRKVDNDGILLIDEEANYYMKDGFQLKIENL